MDTSTTLPVQPRTAPVAALLSLAIPGAGQLYLKDRNRALAIFATALTLFLSIYWAYDNYRVALFELGTVETSWLWILLVLFWAWNVDDAYRLAQGKRVSNYIGIIIATFVIYVIAWQVTDVRLDRLITRFGNALKIGNDLIHPDLFTQDAAGNWMPSENFLYIFGTIERQPPPDILVRLGLVSSSTLLPVYEAGKIVE